MARMHELASASPPYEQVPNTLRYTFNNLFIIYPLNGYFTIDSAPIYTIQDHPAFHFAVEDSPPLGGRKIPQAPTCLNLLPYKEICTPIGG